MFKMRQLNKGYVTVELSIIIPVIFMVIFSLINLFIDLINEGVYQEREYSSIYTFSKWDNSVEKTADLIEDIQTSCINEGLGSDLVIQTEDDEVRLFDRNRKKEYCTEIDKCSQRLRRWQLYGDIVQ